MSVIIKDSVIVTGSNLVKNDYYIKYFKEMGVDVTDFVVNVLGRDERFIANGIDENTLTLGAKAVDLILERNKLTGNDVDLILFTSQFPEYTCPSQACMIHNHIKGKEECVTLDVNVNCLGMLRGMDIINRYLNDKKGNMKRALLIGSDYMSIHAKKDDVLSSCCFGDGACAVILEYTDEQGIGIIDSADRTISNEAYKVIFPECGISNVSLSQGEINKLSWSNPFTDPLVKAIKSALDEIMDKHLLSTDDIDWLCPSQFTYKIYQEIREECNIPEEKSIYIGNKYGYTGTSSPFFAYTEGIKQGKIKKGDLVLFSSIGLGLTISSMLVRV